MKKRRSICPNPVPNDQLGTSYDCSHEYRSFGFYVLGGMDVTGEHTSLDANITFDEQNDIDNGCGVDAFSDPTVGFFEVAESMGVEAAEAYAQQKAE